MKALAAIAAIWIAIAVVWWLSTGADVAKAAKKSFPTPEQIAAFYSGGNMKGTILYDYTNSMGTTGAAGSGSIRLNPSLQKGWQALVKNPRSQNALVLGSMMLSTLIHESLHNRDFSNGTSDSPFFGPEDEQLATGFRRAGNEIQAGDLGIRLVPDAMQRFFGIKMDSPWGRKYLEATMKRLKGSYGNP